jgi:hypothetical protein
MPITRPARTLAAACLVLVTLFGMAPRPAAALEPPRPLPDHRPTFVTETDTRPFIDCLWASAAMLLDKWTNGNLRVTHGELRRLAGDRGGSSLEDLQVAFRRLGFGIALDARGNSTLTWGALLARLGRGAGAVVLGDESHLPRWYGRWDYQFWQKTGKKDNHAVYIERYDRRRGRVWLMDPLARGAWQGEWISVSALRRFAWFRHGYVAAVTTPTARAAPFAGVIATWAQVGISETAVTATWRLRTPRRWTYPGADVRASITPASDPIAAAIATAQLDSRATADPAPKRPVAGVSHGTLRISAALPMEPGAYVARLTMTDRRFGRRVVTSEPVAVFVPGDRRATLRLSAHEHFLDAGESVRVHLSVANTGLTTWGETIPPDADGGDVREGATRAIRERATRVTATWVRLDPSTAGETAETAQLTVELGRVPLRPGALVRISESLEVPGQVGRWALVLDVVDDLEGSFAARGSAPAVAIFEVVAPRGTHDLVPRGGEVVG